MIHVYLLAVGGLRCQMEKMAYIKGEPNGSPGIGRGVLSMNPYAADLPGWDKLTCWQQEKISRCATPGAGALCMGGQLLLQYGAYEWPACDSLLQREPCGKKNIPGDKDVKGATSFEVSDSESVSTENGISWHIMDYPWLMEHIPAPQPLAVAYESKGKPYILHVPWYHNLSHSGDYVALAMSDAPVGIDIQQMRPYRDSLVKRFFSAEESAVYESLISMEIQGGDVPAYACQDSTDAQGGNAWAYACQDSTDAQGGNAWAYACQDSTDARRQNAAGQRLSGDGETLFYTLWCRKEAYGKLLGTGLNEEVLKCNMLEEIGVHLYEYGELPDYRICVCSRDRSL